MINVIIIHYLAHQILTNKNSPSEMYNQLRKMETTHNQTLHNQNNPEQTLSQEQKLN